MKKTLLILTILSGMLTINSCRKEDNPLLPDLKKVPVPLLQLSSTSGLIIEDPATFESKFNADLYFPDVKPQKFDVVVTKNGDYTDVKVYQADITTFPTEVTISGTKLAQVFNMNIADVVPGTFFEVRVNMTLADGTVIPAFVNGKQSYSSDLQNFPDGSLTLKYQVVCPLDITQFTGQLTAEDGFWEETYPVTITALPGNKLRISNFLNMAGNNFTIDYNPSTRIVTIPKQVYAATVPGYPYTNWAIEGKGELDACTNTIILNGTFTVTQGSFGSYPVIITK